MSGDFVGDSQYVAAKTSVWWDIENCQVPRNCDVHAIAQNISSALVNMKYCGPVFISAYGDTNKIPNSVQQALSSTGITLNHVPAGVKDASDKKILVDMLFWAVDNPAPANYLLISGDRDFSNALHQLRMRRYNILLAQPHKASAPLVAAAKSVWLWTSLLAGGPPLSEGESHNLLGNNFTTSTSNTAQVLVSDGFPVKLPVTSVSETPHLGNQKNPHVAKGYDNKQKGKTSRRNLSQPNGAKNEPLRSQEVQYNPNNFRPGPYIPKFPTSGSTPDFSPGNSNFTWSDVTHVNGNQQNNYVQPLRPNIPSTQPVSGAGSAYPPNLHAHAPPLIPARPNGANFSSPLLGNFPDIGNMSIYPNNFHNPPNVQPPPPQRRNGEVKHELKQKSSKPVMTNLQNGFTAQNTPSVYQETQNNRYTASHEYSSSSSSVGMSVSSGTTGVWGTPGCPRPSDYVQGLIGVILLALNTLKSEKLIPTESNIIDCIRYGDSKHQNTDVKKALESAVDQQMVVKQNLGAVQLYVGKNDKLWKCVNPIGGNPKDVQKSTWDEIQAFLTSPTGRSAILASRCRYEAGTILKSMCLKELALGDILQILNMVISMKKWIIHHQSGWQPLNITLAEVDTSLVSASATLLN